MHTKLFVTALALLSTQSGPCSSGDYTPCYDSPVVVPVPTGVDGGTATSGDGGVEPLRCEPLCAPTHDGKPFADCELSTSDGGAPTVTCHYHQRCGA